MTNKKSFVIPVIILVAIALFCAVMCLSVHFSLSNDNAFAFDIEVSPNISGTFTQYIKSGLVPSLDDGWTAYNSNSAVKSYSTYAYVYPVDSSGTCGITYPLPDIIQDGHQYLLHAHLLANNSVPYPTYYVELPYGDTVPFSSNGFYDREYFELYTANFGSGREYLSFYSSTPGAYFGVACVELIDISLLTFDYDPMNVQGFYEQYFGYNYHDYTLGVSASDINTYSLYSNGYNVGFDDGFAEGVLITRAQSYETVSSNFTYGSSSYAYNERGILQPVHDGFDFLNIGWQDMFPTATWNSIKKVKSVSVSCVMNLYTYQETYNPDNREYVYTDTTLYQPNILFKTSRVEYHSDLETIICELFYNIEGLGPNQHLMEILIRPHNTRINFVDRYIDSANVWPRTWYAVGAKNAPSDYLFTFDINPIDSSTSYELGYDNGIKYADNRVYEGSASFTAGYNRGIDNASNATFPSVISAAIDVPIKSLTSLLNFELFGTNLNTFVLSLLSFGIVIGIVKLILGR